MNKKIIFSDFDGTLVGRELHVSDRVKKAITAWEDAGHLFTLATGRIFAGHVEKIAKELNLISPQVSMGGAQIVDPLTKKVIFEDVMHDEDVKRLFEILEKKEIHFWAEKDFVIYNNLGIPRHASHAIIPHSKLADLPKHAIPKVGIRPEDNPEKMHFIEHELTEMFPRLHIIRAGSAAGMVYDVTVSTASKHSGVLKVLDFLKLTQEDTIGVGDGFNDFPLLSVAGYKVAMGNAPEELKEIADFVAPTQEEDGVAVMIERLLEAV